MICTVAGLTGHVHQTSNSFGIWKREEVFNAGFDTLVLLAQSKQESLPNPKGAVTTSSNCIAGICQSP